MTREVIRVREASYIISTSPRIDDRTRVLKHGDMFAVFDRYGDVEAFGRGDQGIFYNDTRFLSRLTVRLGRDRPLLLSSTIKNDNASLAVDAMNTDVERDGQVAIPGGTVHLFRSKFLWNGTCHEHIRVQNFGKAAAVLDLTIAFDADFADIFEVRGARRERRGRRAPTQVESAGIVFVYEGLDARERRTRIQFDTPPDRLTDSEARFDLHLPAGEARDYRYAITCEIDDAGTPDGAAVLRRPSARIVSGFSHAAREAGAERRRSRGGGLEITTSNEQLNGWLDRSVADLHMMRTMTPHGPYPYAGVPWFCTPFGRDGIITALECLSFHPELARGVLSYLAATQADELRPEQDAEPGKVLHETRAGEMAALGEVPFRRYYGSIDATPLFVMLAGAYHERTGDTAFAETIWPNVERAVAWMDTHGTPGDDGFVRYARKASSGLIHQGWKDSHDSVFHADGSAARPPIALCEVQGYAYAARLGAGRLATALGADARAAELTGDAETLRRRFEAAFWCDDLSTYALALDGDGRPCRVRASNAGHCLYAGIASGEHARLVASTLTGDASYSGWGIRTLAAGETCYNPMSYHNGSIWPHDNALIAAGFARYGLKDEVNTILTGLLDASALFEMHRLPELFCGFHRRSGEAPTEYPVACAPQTWAAAAAFLLLESCLGLEVRGVERRVILSKPTLPNSVRRVTIRNLRVDAAELDLLVTRHREGDVSINVLRREGSVEVEVRK